MYLKREGPSPALAQLQHILKKFASSVHGANMDAGTSFQIAARCAMMIGGLGAERKAASYQHTAHMIFNILVSNACFITTLTLPQAPGSQSQKEAEQLLNAYKDKAASARAVGRVNSRLI